ncbi:unnamed protein product [Closterium sp. NIES-54]
MGLYDAVAGMAVRLLDIISTYLQVPFFRVNFLDLTVDGHLILETILLVTIVVLMSQKSYKPDKRSLTETEIDHLCEEWVPEPLHPPAPPQVLARHVPVLDKAGEPWTVADGRKMLNLASMNFLGLIGNTHVQEAATAALHKYGVGSCGPRGFYGTIDVHLDLEERIAAFMGVEGCILYSYGLATVASTIPAFCKRGDLIIADEGVGWAMQNGMTLARSTVRYFRHNDMRHLEQLLQHHAAADRKSNKTDIRRFIAVEALYQCSGELLPLPELVRLKEKYKFRIIVEESLSFGVLGATGRGISEHYGMPVTSIDIIVAAMGTSLASVGGFCCGSAKVVDHQRLGGMGYCFSASLPPFLASAAMAALDEMEARPTALSLLQSNAAAFREGMATHCPDLEVHGHSVSPVVLLRVRKEAGAGGAVRDGEDEPTVLQRIVDEMREGEDVLVSVPLRSPLDISPLPAGIRSRNHGPVTLGYLPAPANTARALRRLSMATVSAFAPTFSPAHCLHRSAAASAATPLRQARALMAGAMGVLRNAAAPRSPGISGTARQGVGILERETTAQGRESGEVNIYRRDAGLNGGGFSLERRMRLVSVDCSSSPSRQCSAVSRQAQRSALSLRHHCYGTTIGPLRSIPQPHCSLLSLPTTALPLSSRSSCGGLKRESGFIGACARAGANVDTSATATEEQRGGAGADTGEEEATASGAVNGDEAGQQPSRTGKGKQKGDVKATEKRKGNGKGEAVKLMLYNTMSRSKEEFVPLQAGHVGMYVCGVTVYDYSHIGHARVYVSFDVLYRYLQHMGYDVTYVRNFTDVDDKIIKRALDLGEDPLHLSRRFIKEFHADMHALGCLPPTHEPKVSDHIADIIHMIQQIVDSGAGYVVDGGDVFFDVDKAEGYGQLSGRRQEENRAGERVAVDERKRNPADFALWKSAKPGEVSWASPWGAGRPGWHIECSAMSKRYLGFRFDIHGGGRDLIFPHHENELAQSKAAAAAAAAAGDGAVQAQQHVHAQQQEGCLHCAGEHGGEEGEACGVSVWLHNGFVNVDSEKMSKSLGNFFTIREVLDRFHAVAVRWFLLCTHYRSPINYSDRQLDRASDRVFYLYQLLADCEAANCQQQQQVSSSVGASKPPPAPAKAAVTAAAQVRLAAAAALADDLHTAQAVASLSEPLKLMADLLGAKKYKKDPTRGPSLMVLQEAVLSVLALLGLPTTGFSPLLEELKQLALKRAGMSAEQVQGMLEQRDEARKAKDFARSDAIRDELALVGIMLMDTPAGTAWRPAAISVQDDTDESGGLTTQEFAERTGPITIPSDNSFQRFSSSTLSPNSAAPPTMCRPQVDRPLAALSLLHHQLQQRRQPWLAPDWSPPESVPDEAEAAAAWLRFQRRRVRLLTRRMRFLLLLLLTLGVLQIFLGAYVSFCFHVAVAKHRARNQELQQALVRAGEAWEWQQQWWARSKRERARGRGAGRGKDRGEAALGLPTAPRPGRSLLALESALNAMQMTLPGDAAAAAAADVFQDDAGGCAAADACTLGSTTSGDARHCNSSSSSSHRHLQHHAVAPAAALSSPWEGSNHPCPQQLLLSAVAGTAVRQHYECQAGHEGGVSEQGEEGCCRGQEAEGEETRWLGAWEEMDPSGDCWLEESAAGCMLDGLLSSSSSRSSSRSSCRSSSSASSTREPLRMGCQPLATCPVPATPALSSLLCPSPPQLQYTLW